MSDIQFKSKTIKFNCHDATKKNADILISTDTVGLLQANELLKIEFINPGNSSIILSIVSKPEFVNKSMLSSEYLSVSTELLNDLLLKRHYEARVQAVNNKDYHADFVEITFKDQYFSRTDMFRLKENILNSCIYVNQKISFGSMKLQINEIWFGNEGVSSGFVTEKSRVAFRSFTAQINIFIQMSREMWSYDIGGFLYYERAVDGFLSDLFETWARQRCNHDVTLTLFSRVFFNNSYSINQLPAEMRECLQQNSDGEYYEDFYRVVVQNERYDDWTPTLKRLRMIMKNYRNEIYTYYNTYYNRKPNIFLSTAEKGNVLEVLNMSLNVFDKYFLDRCLDRTGKVSIVVTPGAGVFDVSSELVRLTRERTLHCGNCSDLVCLGQQPLHAVPLLRMKNCLDWNSEHIEYLVPHWINHSFYSTIVQNDSTTGSKKTFHSRITIPTKINRKYGVYVPPVFRNNNVSNKQNRNNEIRCKKVNHKRHHSDSKLYFLTKTCQYKNCHHLVKNLSRWPSLNNIYLDKNINEENTYMTVKKKTNVMPTTASKINIDQLKCFLSPINPFDGADTFIMLSRSKWTPNRRRWAHAYPNKDDYCVWSVDSTTGVDWKALAVPVCFPLTIDFIAWKKLNSSAFLQNDDSYDCSLIHAKATPKELFMDFIYQRLSHGFQLIVETNIDLTDKSKEKCVLLSLGDTIHRISINELQPGIKNVNITRYKPKHSGQLLPIIDYKYRFQIPDSSVYQISSTNFICSSANDINWTYLDTYFFMKKCRLQGYSIDVETKYWRLRFVILSSYYYKTSQKLIDSSVETNFDIYEEMSLNEEERLNCFTLFATTIANLYGLKRTIQPIKKSSIVGINDINSTDGDLKSIISAMLKASSKDLPMFNYSNSNKKYFLTAYACQWLISCKQFQNIHSIEDALATLKQLVDNRLIVIASNTTEVIYGLCICYVADGTKANAENAKDFNDDCEPLIEYIYQEPKYINKKKMNGNFNTSTFDCSNLLNNDREEWLDFKHHIHYSPYYAFEFEIQSVACAGSTLSDLIGAWYRKSFQIDKATSMHIVPVPGDPFVLADSDPLRKPIFIALKFDQQRPTSSNMLDVQVKILQRFGFIPIGIHSPTMTQNISEQSNCDNDQYIHSTGSILIIIKCFQNKNNITNFGYLWSWNWMLNGKWRNKQTGGEEFQDRLLANFRAFCNNSDNRLNEFLTSS